MVLGEWKRCFMDDNNAIFHIADAKSREMQCPPITPYYGMPETYKSYDLIIEGLINELLLTSPCREGFKFVGKLSEINQCNNGAWRGSGFPDCEGEVELP